MNGLFGNWAGLAMHNIVTHLTNKFIPAHPILAILSLLAACFFFFSFIGAFVLASYSMILFYAPQQIAIWILLGSLFFLFIICLLIGRVALKPRSQLVEQKRQTLTQESFQPKKNGGPIDVATAFLDGFFSK